MKKMILASALLASVSIPAIACDGDTTPPNPISVTSVIAIGDNSIGAAVDGIEIDYISFQPTDVASIHAYGCEGLNCSDRVEYSAQYQPVGPAVPTMPPTMFPGVSITGLNPGTDYNFVITATDACGNTTQPSNEFTFQTTGEGGAENNAPTAPYGLSATSVEENSLYLQWTASTDPDGHQVAYTIEYRVAGEQWEEYSNVQYANSLIIGLQSETTYDFRVKSFDQEGAESDYSEILTETTAVDLFIGECFYSKAKDHASAGRAYKSNKVYYATGSDTNIGSRNNMNSLQETSEGYWEVVSGC